MRAGHVGRHAAWLLIALITRPFTPTLFTTLRQVSSDVYKPLDTHLLSSHINKLNERLEQWRIQVISHAYVMLF